MGVVEVILICIILLLVFGVRLPHIMNDRRAETFRRIDNGLCTSCNKPIGDNVIKLDEQLNGIPAQRSKYSCPHCGSNYEVIDIPHEQG